MDLHFGRSGLFITIFQKELLRNFKDSGDIRVFERGLRVIYSLLLPAFDGFLIHGTGLSEHQRGFIFFGPSGAGKTTIANLAAGKKRRILTDELCAVRKTSGGYKIFSTPFHGEFKGGHVNECAPLKGLFRLEKATAPALHALPAAPAAIAVLQSVLNFSTEANDNRRLMDIVSDLLDQHPAMRLAFARDARFLEVLEEAYA